jgi:hypothetical protein
MAGEPSIADIDCGTKISVFEILIADRRQLID